MKSFDLLFILFITTQIEAWNYANQAYWFQTYPDCAGNLQSPIDIPISKLQKDHLSTTNIQTNYISKSGLAILNDGGHTQKVEGSWGTTGWDDKNYHVQQFHTHQPAEHTFDTIRYDMEMHFVHQYGSREDYLVLAVFF